MLLSDFEEAVPRLSFGNYKMGQPVQVDIHDPVVAGLVKAGYLKIRWKEPNGTHPLDPAGSGHVSAGGVDPDDPRGAETAQVDDVADQHRSAEESGAGAEAG